MRTHADVRSGWAGARGAVLLCALLAATGCGLNDVDIPELDGPSALAANLTLRIEPDLLVADGRSTALVTAQFFDQNGRPVPNRAIFFTIADEDGRFAAIGNFPTAEGPGFAVTVNTDSGGFARVVYQVPPRTDATADQTVLIAARPIGDDANAAIYRTVRLELRSAEPRMFPPAPGNAAPVCGLSVEAPSGFRTNVAILFTTTSRDPDGVIIRYEWFCGSGNGGPIHSPDVACVYRTPGSYSVTQQVTDDDGAQSECGTTVTIRP